MKSEKKARSLIMCTSPLQMLIAEKIIELNPDKKFDLLVKAPIENVKYRYYYNKLNRLCSKSMYCTSKGGLKNFLRYIIELKLNGLNIQYNSIYLASIDVMYFQYIISKNNKSDIFTFDDGLANIIPGSLYYLNSKPALTRRVIWRMFGIKLYMEQIKKSALLHYTIYKDVPNIIKNVEFVELYKEDITYLAQKGEIVRIYLGQPLKELSSQFTDSYLVDIMERLNIHYYYPHPKEEELITGKFEIIRSPLIFEDYILVFLKDNPGVTVEVYSFFSSATLNIANFNRIDVKIIYNAYFYANYKFFYDLAEESFQTTCINLDAYFI